MLSFIIDVSKFNNISEYEAWEKSVVVGAFDYWSKVSISKYPKKLQATFHVEGTSEDIRSLAEKYEFDKYLYQPRNN